MCLAFAPFTFPTNPMIRRAEPETETRTDAGPPDETVTEIDPGSKTADNRSEAVRWTHGCSRRR